MDLETHPHSRVIYLCTGKLGGGKTLLGVHRALDVFARGSYVVSNVQFLEEGVGQVMEARKVRFDYSRQFRFHDFEEEPDYFNVLKKGYFGRPTFMLCDEAHLYYPADNPMRQHEQLKRVNSFNSQSRKFFVDMMFVTQDLTLLYNRIRLQAEHRYHCIDLRKKSAGPLGKMPFQKLKWYEKDVKSDLIQGEGVTNLDSKIFQCFDSHQKYDAFSRKLYDDMPQFDDGGGENKLTLREQFATGNRLLSYFWARRKN